MVKNQVLRLNKKLIDYSKTAAWNVWRQFGVDLDTYKKERLDVSKFYMPQKVQEELVKLMLKNSPEYKKPKAKSRLTNERIDLFPAISRGSKF